MTNIALGRYIPNNSWVHRLDPRIKIVNMLLLMIAVFLPARFAGYGVLMVVAVGLVLLSKLKFGFIVKSLKPVLLMLVFLLLINIFVLRTGYVVVNIFGLMVFSDALFQTAYIVVRLLLMIMITTLLTATTKPLDLTLGIEDLLSPFKRFKVPAHEIAMMISIALRFIPTLIEESQRIMKAQASRGVDLNEGKLNEKIVAILSLIVPLFVSSFQRAEELADAMEARGYSPTSTRTRYKQLKVTFKDWIAFSFVMAVLVGVGFLAWLA
ncbi:MAG: energy-coupling factor transporter transmembrane protein EcfT [Erysipelotrichia bacterium]|jgi:energy-coupling factor transport system permease protein|nr:energy-coupling factor transporter transmembrane protein EcfT [Erysipelotrichia bacterium]